MALSAEREAPAGPQAPQYRYGVGGGNCKPPEFRADSRPSDYDRRGMRTTPSECIGTRSGLASCHCSGYRIPLYEMLAQSGFNVRFVGSQAHAPLRCDQKAQTNFEAR